MSGWALALWIAVALDVGVFGTLWCICIVAARADAGFAQRMEAED
jgi:hypothetical protein